LFFNLKTFTERFKGQTGKTDTSKQ